MATGETLDAIGVLKDFFGSSRTFSAAPLQLPRDDSPERRRFELASDIMSTHILSDQNRFETYDDMAFDAVQAADALLKQLEIPNA